MVITVKDCESIKELQPGTVVRSKFNRANVYIINANFGDYAIGTRVQHVSSPDEWEIIK